jgi:stearoyl-CoA desaturase (delta-9 desaturase)
MAGTEKSSILVEPHYGYAAADGLPYKPTCAEAIREWLHVMNCVHNPQHSLTAINFLFQIGVGVAFIIFMTRFLSLDSFLFMLLVVLVFGTGYNTVWYHRYCSDLAFRFSHLTFAKIFLWTNPLAFIFREEIYAIPHKIHHQRTDKPGDPYGPHLGYLANFLSPELTQRINPNISREEFRARQRTILHIGLHSHSYEQFRRTASIENVYYYAARIIVTQFIWISLTSALGGHALVLAYYSAIFITTILIRDFNWRGHGGNVQVVKRNNWEFDKKTRALNQYFYGFIASEWHDNHHHYITSANNGFLASQIDIAFIMIQALHRLGIIKSYINAETLFRKQCLLSHNEARAE